MFPSRICRWVGAALIANFIWVVIARLWAGRGEELFWLSHVGTLAAGIGLLLAHDYVVSMALVCLFVFHGVWMVDGGWWALTGRFPVGVCYFLADHSWFELSATIHHFYVLPVLVVWLLWRRRLHPRAWVGASLLFSGLVLIGALFLSAEMNVNSAHAVWPGLDRTFLGYADRLPRPLYVLVLILAATFVNFWVVNRALSAAVGLLNRRWPAGPRPAK